ncbi:unnamed protein product [Ectocarpus sp. CCAP 1310/34]|nr:unnamed protein product [Ectocarpus sp. CCAP 1310/34]
MSAFSFENGVYSTPPETFLVSAYGNFCNFYRSLITHVGANEDRDYYAAWLEQQQLKLAKGSARSRRRSIDLYTSGRPARDETFIVERLLESVDTRLSDHHILVYTDDIMDAIESNTSIVEVSAYSQTSSCRCRLFNCFSKRSVSITSLDLTGRACIDSTQTIADSCVHDLKRLSLSTGCSDQEMDGLTIALVCDAVAEAGADGLIRALETCPISSLRIDGTIFDIPCVPGMVRVLPELQATDVKLTQCDFDNWGKPVFDALFSNENIRWLGVSSTKIGDGSVGALVDMVTRGTLTRLAIGNYGMGRGGIRRVLEATTHAGSNVVFISIFDNDIDVPSIFEGLGKTSLTGMHVGELSNCNTAIANFVADTQCDIDTSDADDCYNGGGGVFPWRTESRVVYVTGGVFGELIIKYFLRHTSCHRKQNYSLIDTLRRQWK